MKMRATITIMGISMTLITTKTTSKGSKTLIKGPPTRGQQRRILDLGPQIQDQTHDLGLIMVHLQPQRLWRIINKRVWTGLKNS